MAFKLCACLLQMITQTAKVETNHSLHKCNWKWDGIWIYSCNVGNTNMDFVISFMMKCTADTIRRLMQSSMQHKGSAWLLNLKEIVSQSKGNWSRQNSCWYSMMKWKAFSVNYHTYLSQEEITACICASRCPCRRVWPDSLRAADVSEDTDVLYWWRCQSTRPGAFIIVYLVKRCDEVAN